MKTIWLWVGIGLGSLLIVLAGISPSVGEVNKLGGDERPVMAATEAPLFGTEDWVPPQGEVQVVAIATPSFGTEDWVPPQGEAQVVAIATPSFGTEDWVGSMESSDVVGTGTLPEPAR
jgi:hypothetical protein